MAKRPHILIVEDDEELSLWISDYLQSHGFDTTRLTRGDEAATQVHNLEPQLVLLDVMLPGKNGFSVCKEIRQFSRLPILMMTACSEEADELKGLDCGADDYLNKPVRPKVLLARIHALLRRAPSMHEQPLLSFGALTLELHSKTTRIADKVQPVSGNEFDVLWLLATHAGQILSRAELVSQLRGIDYDGLDRSIDNRVARLRKKLEPDPDNPTRIKTIWGKGYLFVENAW